MPRACHRRRLDKGLDACLDPRTMLDHIGFGVSDFARSKAFYLAALAPLGYGVVMEFTPGPGEQHLGLGPPERPYFWIGTGPTLKGKGPLHVAFVAKDRAAVDAFYRAAMAAGGKDNGPPGLRPHYHPNYYGAFVLDPDGHNVEAVCHTP
jgi:catechol 2,3-dioxygenase-like lactoylglutathione lyase family enzyme